MRIVYLGSPEIAVHPLEYLIKNSEHQIVAVVSQPDKKQGRGLKLQASAVANYARSHNIKVFCPTKASSEDFLEDLSNLKPDLCITCAYGQMLSQSFLDIPKYGTINIHPSALPTYRGATPIQSALKNGDRKTAITILLTVKKMDAGPIILQEEKEIKDSDTAETLAYRLFKESGNILIKAIEKVSQGFSGSSQDENKVIPCKKITKEQGQISWKQDSREIFNQYRAYTPWPGIFTHYQQKRVVLSELAISHDYNIDKNQRPGEFFFDKQTNKLVVIAKDSAIYIGKLKKEGKSFCSAKDFFNGVKNNNEHLFL
jgi:methionyl-tRNA formyltransferase